MNQAFLVMDILLHQNYEIKYKKRGLDCMAVIVCFQHPGAHAGGLRGLEPPPLTEIA